MRYRSCVVGFGLVACVCATVACGSERPSILIVLLDAVRADHLNAYGYGRPTSPFLAELGANGACFEHAFAAAPWTLPSVATLLTGLYPDQHGAGTVVARPDSSGPGVVALGRRGFSGLAPGVRTLARFLDNEGYVTGAVVNNIFLQPSLQIGRGFDHYDWYPSRDSAIRRADETVDAARKWLGSLDQERPVFLLVHFMDPHYRYDAPPPFRDTFSRPYSQPYGALPEARSAAEQEGAPEFFAAEYDEEIAFVDQQLQRLVGIVRESRRDWIIVITADHGESFGEVSGHGSRLDAAQLDVPLVLTGPGIKPRRISEPVSLVDVTPTLLEAAKAVMPKHLAGISMWPALRGGKLPARPLYAGHLLYGRARRAVVVWPYKLVADIDGSNASLYDLARDPGETIDFARLGSPEHQHVLAATLPLLTRTGPQSPRREVELDRETRETLRALGYLR